MNTMTLNHHQQPVSKGFRVDISRGENIGRVSSEWFSRPDDERYLSLTELYDAVKGRAVVHGEIALVYAANRYREDTELSGRRCA